MKDNRLLNASGEMENNENFSRILAIVDALETRIEALEPSEE